MEKCAADRRGRKKFSLERYAAPRPAQVASCATAPAFLIFAARSSRLQLRVSLGLGVGLLGLRTASDDGLRQCHLDRTEFRVLRVERRGYRRRGRQLRLRPTRMLPRQGSPIIVSLGRYSVLGSIQYT